MKTGTSPAEGCYWMDRSVWPWNILICPDGQQCILWALLTSLSEAAAWWALLLFTVSRCEECSISIWSTVGGHWASFHLVTIANYAAFIIRFVHTSLAPRTRTWSETVALKSSFLCSALTNAAKECTEGFSWFTHLPASSCGSASSPTFGITRLCFCWSGGSVAYVVVLIFSSLVTVRLTTPHVLTGHLDFSS